MLHRVAAAGRRTLATLSECLLVTLLVVLALEGLSRALHLGRRPMLPFVTDAALGARMAPGFDSTVVFPGGGPFRVCTDGQGLRLPVCDVAPANATPTLLTVGDSQAFGWGMEFADTFTAGVAQALGVPPHDARIMAAGGADVETLAAWAADYRRAAPSAQPALNIVVVNLGNDLDEMYFGRSTGKVPLFKELREWLTVHSYFMLDFTLAKNALFDVSDWQLPPGANPVVLNLGSGELDQLARATAESAARLARALPTAGRTVILVLPTDYQIAASEFDKYRGFYRSAAQFESWRRRIAQAAAALDGVGHAVRDRLVADGFTVVTPQAALRGSDPTEVFDRSSHHYTPLGQRLLAAAIVQELRP